MSPGWRRGTSGALVLGWLLVSACASDADDGLTDETDVDGAAGQAGKGGAAGQGGSAAGGKSGASGQGGKAGKGGAPGTSGQGGAGGDEQGGAGGDEQGGAGGDEQGGAGGDDVFGGAGGDEQGGAGGDEQGGAGGDEPGGAGGGAGKAGAPAGPTCKQLGGDRCGKEKDDCAGLSTLKSSDCVVCCEVPSNPVFPGGFADPFIARDGDTYYAFATGGSVLRRESKNLVSWGKVEHALTKSPWKDAQAGFWAPTVYKAKSGKWVLYYAAETSSAANKQHCIGKAVSNTPGGTFQPGAKPIICPAGGFWAIDPSVFRDSNGKDYLLWRQDTKDMSHGNVFIRQLDADGNLVGQAHEILSRASKEPSWEFDSQGGVLENPAMVRHGNVYHLFYSGNRWETAKYANGHATCSTPFGPCKKTSTVNPWQGSKGKMLGPGGADVVKAKDGTLLMYMHGWESPDVGPGKGQRKLWLYRLLFSGNTPAITPL